MKRLLVLLILFLLISVIGQAQTVIRVPQDQPTIQAAINVAVNGDTVLVAEGTYVENIRITKKIVLGSLFLQDRDTSHISETILDGSSPNHPDTGSVVVFDTGSDSTSLLVGFTVKKGTGTRLLEQPSYIFWRGGGGIMIIDGGARIRYNRITSNSVSGDYCFGGGVANWDTAAYVIIESNTIDMNISAGKSYDEGGGISIGCKSYIANNIIARNTINIGLGGGVSLWGDYVHFTTPIVFINNTVAYNGALRGVEGMAIYNTNEVRMMNNIIWNPGDGVDMDPVVPAISASNNLVRGNFVGNNNLNVDPEFSDTVNFELSPTSPCISAGRDTATMSGTFVAAPLVDRHGSGRPQIAGTLPDLGAVESNSHTVAPVRQDPQLSYHELFSSGFEREYFVFLPKNYASMTSVRLLISLHGCGGSGQSQMRFGFSDMVDSMDFIVVYPSSFGSCWEDGAPGRTLHYDVFFIDELIDSMIAQYRVDSTEIYLTGFSSGGFLTYRLAGESRHHIAGIAPVAATIGLGVTPPPPPGPIPMIYFHGTADNNVPYNGNSSFSSVGQVLANWASYNHADTVAVTDMPNVNTSDNSTVQKIVYQPSPGISGASIHFYRVDNGVHAVPGPQFWWRSPVNQDVNAPIEIMKFFSQSDQLTAAEEVKITIPETFALFQNYPNPFNPSTEITYRLPFTLHTSLKIYDVLGREVATLVNKEQPAGVYKAEWTASVASGVYFYRLEALGKDGKAFAETRKLLLLK